MKTLALCALLLAVPLSCITVAAQAAPTSKDGKDAAKETPRDVAPQPKANQQASPAPPQFSTEEELAIRTAELQKANAQQALYDAEKMLGDTIASVFARHSVDQSVEIVCDGPAGDPQCAGVPPGRIQVRWRKK